MSQDEVTHSAVSEHPPKGFPLWEWEQTLVGDPAVSSRKQDTFPRTMTDTPAHSLTLLTLAGGASLNPPEIIDIINIAETCYFHTRR